MNSMQNHKYLNRKIICKKIKSCRLRIFNKRRLIDTNSRVNKNLSIWSPHLNLQCVFNILKIIGQFFYLKFLKSTPR